MGEVPAELKGKLIYHPDINWWSAARRGQHGKGVFLLTVDRNGEVSEIKVVKSTGYPYLNEIAAKQLFAWRFQPGVLTQARIPIDFHLKGYFKEIHRSENRRGHRSQSPEKTSLRRAYRRDRSDSL